LREIVILTSISRQDQDMFVAFGSLWISPSGSCARRRWKYAVGAEECSAARVEQKNGMTKEDKNGVIP